ncbi:MAG: hypothetical protein ABI559_00920, partial [Chloroflexota bacterium]
MIRTLGAALLVAGLVFMAGTASSTSAGRSAQEKIVYTCSAGGPGTNFEICAIQPDGTEFENLSNSPVGDTGPEISPDG